MVEFTGGDRLNEYLAVMAKQVEKPGTLRVGFLEKATYPDGTPVALVAAIQNFGAPAMGIPPRPFFSNMIRSKSPGWGAAVAANLRATNYDATATLNLMGAGIAGQLSQSIDDTNAPPLAEATIAAKGFEKPLIDSGDMRRALETGNTPWEVA